MHTDASMTNSAVKLERRGTTIISARETARKLAMGAGDMVSTYIRRGLRSRLVFL